MRKVAWVIALALIVAIALLLAFGRGGSDSATAPMPVPESKSTAHAPANEIRPAEVASAPPAAAEHLAPLEESASDEGTDPGPHVVEFKGRVTFQGGGPAEGTAVTVQFTSLDPATERYAVSTVTDASGRYRIEARDGTGHEVIAEKEGYARESARLTNHASMQQKEQTQSRRETELDFVLVPEAVVSGRVLDLRGDPIENASVTANWTTTHGVGTFREFNLVRAEMATSHEGNFDLRGVKPGAITLIASAQGYVMKSREITAPAAGVEFRLADDGAEVYGIVTKMETGDTVASATVELLPLPNRISGAPRELITPIQVHSDENGRFSFIDLPPGRYRLDAGKDKLRLFAFDSAAEPFELADSEIKSGLLLQLYAGHSIRGQVFEFSTNNPIPNIKITAGSGARDGQLSEDVTDENGFYRLTGIFGNATTLFPSGGGWMTTKKDRFGTLGEIVRLSADNLEEEHDFELMRVVTVSGRVQFTDGRPGVGAKVSPVGWHTKDSAATTPVNSNGEFEVEVSPSSQLSLFAELPNYPRFYSDWITVRLDSVTGVIITIHDPASISGVVKDTDGNVIEGATVSVSHPVRVMPDVITRTSGGTRITDALGRYDFTAVTPGDVSISAKKEGFANSVEKRPRLLPGERMADVELLLRKSSFVAGTVVDNKDNPLEGIDVHLFEEGIMLQATTNARGYFHVEGAAGGRLNGSLRRGPEVRSITDIQINDENQRFVFDDENLATLIGTVVDAETKEPISKFRVWVDGSTSGKHPRLDANRPGGFIWEGLRPRTFQSLNITSEGYPPHRTENVDPEPGVAEFVRTFELSRGVLVSGRIIDKSSRFPIDGATVELQRLYTTPFGEQPIAITKSGADGRFAFKNVLAQQVRLLASHGNGYADKVVLATIEADASFDFGEIELDAGRTLTVTAVDSTDGKPVPGIMINLVRGLSMLDTLGGGQVTDANGIAVFAGLTNDERQLDVDKHGIRVRLPPSAGDQEFRLFIGNTTLRGTVLKGGQPLAANISASARIGGADYSFTSGSRTDPFTSGSRTEEPGKFTIARIPAGRWTFSIGLPDQSRGRQNFEVDVPDTDTFEHTFHLTAGAITAIVLDESGKPAPRAALKISTPAGEMREFFDVVANEKGRFTFEHLNAGSYIVSASRLGLGSASQDIELVEEQRADVTLMLKKQGGTLVSTVYHYESSKPLPQAWCKLTEAQGRPFDHSARRGTDGVMTINYIPAGTYKIEVSAWDYSESHRTVEIKEGETQSIEDVIFPAGTLHWRLLDGAGKPHVGAPYKITPLDPQSMQTAVEGLTDKDGDVYVRGVWPGMYRAQVTINGAVTERDFMLEKLGTMKETTTVP